MPNPNEHRKEYRVTVYRTYMTYVSYTTSVVAEDEEDAKNKANDLDIPSYPSGDWSELGLELDDEEYTIELV